MYCGGNRSFVRHGDAGSGGGHRCGHGGQRRRLERDAVFRTDFNIKSGFQVEDIPRIKYKSKMKEYYKKAGIPVARYHMVDDLKGCLNFVKEVGYPVITKPDNGVGASNTTKISNDDEMKAFFDNKEPSIIYIMEEFIRGEVNTYDAIIDSKGEPLFEAGNITYTSIMDVVNEKGNLQYRYFIPMDDPDTVLLIDSWADQAAIDAHHQSPMMQKLAALRERYDLHMEAKRFTSMDAPQSDEQFLRK